MTDAMQAGTAGQVQRSDPASRNMDRAPAGPGERKGVYATMDDLIEKLQEMNVKIRDAQRAFHTSLQRTAFDKQVLALETKKAAIQLNYQAAMAQGGTQVASGVLGFGGALTGNHLVSAATTSLGKTGEGIGATITPGITRQAQEAQLLGEFQAGTSSDFLKTVAAAADKAAEASRRMHEATRDLTGLQDRIMSAVKF